MRVPILKVGRCLIASIQVELSDQEMTDFQRDLLHEVQKTQGTGVIIDITAVEVLDSFLAGALADMATMVKLVGAKLIVCGMQPAIAMTLVRMGRELSGTDTALDLDRALDKMSRLVEDTGKRGVLYE